MKYKIIINKDDNFLEFIRNFVYFNKPKIVADKNNEYLRSFIDKLTEEDKKNIIEFKDRFFIENEVVFKKYKIKIGLKYIYDFYGGDKFKIKHSREFRNLRLVQDKFDKFVWKEEIIKLKKIEKEIKAFDVRLVDSITKKLNIFFNTKIKQCIKIVLLINFDEYYPISFVNPCYSNLITLSASNIHSGSVINLIGAIVHEYTHLLNNKSEAYNELAVEYKNNKEENWRTNIFPELIAYSVASGNFIKHGYISKIGEFANARSMNFVENKELEKTNKLHKIIDRAIKTSKTTWEYLDRERIIDKDYLNYLFNEYNK